MEVLKLRLKNGEEKPFGPSPQLVQQVMQKSKKRRPPLFEFAHYSDVDGQIQALADLAMAEDWNYPTNPDLKPNPILFNYLQYTFARIRFENKVEYSNRKSHCIFNTGLVTSNQEPIYELFNINRNPSVCEWYFISHVKASDSDLRKFGTLPERADYFVNPIELVYDTRLELRVNYDHILDDNRERFPEEYQKLKPLHLRNLLLGAVESAKQRIRRNYKTAIPQFYHNKMQLLLPLCLESEGKADLALAVERWENHYRAGTVLTLPMALNNARLIARPDTEWLRP